MVAGSVVMIECAYDFIVVLTTSTFFTLFHLGTSHPPSVRHPLMVAPCGHRKWCSGIRLHPVVREEMSREAEQGFLAKLLTPGWDAAEVRLLRKGGKGASFLVGGGKEPPFWWRRRP